MHPFYLLLALFALVCLAALVGLLRWERRKFLRMGKATAWLPARIATLPILLALVALVSLTTRGVSGSETPCNPLHGPCLRPWT